jgi:hypothetical protein
MILLFGKSKWGMDAASLEAFLQRTRDSGFDVADINVPTLDIPITQAADLLNTWQLKCVCFIGVQGKTAAEQMAFADKWIPVAAGLKPLHINFHTGRDIFAFNDNLAIFKHIAELGRVHQIDVTHETHRHRALYSAIEARKYLEQLPDLWLNADFSHWMVVHESNLSDQPETMEMAIQRSRYIHARVGYEEGPQITDPRAPEWQGHVENHLGLWQRIIEANRKAGRPHLVITPEFGPPDYMHTLPFTNQPVADVWDVNTAMMQIIKQRLS